MAGRIVPLPIGQRFHRLVVLAEAPMRTRRHWLCRCDCGREKEIMAKIVLSGGAQSCGCLRLRHGAAKRAEGPRAQSEYTVWLGMRQRCLQPNAPGYPWYGARGITICPQWDDFAVFLADVGPRPSMKHSLDRIDNARGYEPGNVRWATRREQSANMRSNRAITFGGRTMILSDWARSLDLPVSAMILRLRKWPLELALTVPRQSKGARIHRRVP